MGMLQTTEKKEETVWTFVWARQTVSTGLTLTVEYMLSGSQPSDELLFHPAVLRIVSAGQILAVLALNTLASTWRLNQSQRLSHSRCLSTIQHWHILNKEGGGSDGTIQTSQERVWTNNYFCEGQKQTVEQMDARETPVTEQVINSFRCSLLAEKNHALKNPHQFRAGPIVIKGQAVPSGNSPINP